MLLGLIAWSHAAPLYVQASTLALRDGSRAEAAVVGWLRVNTAVEVLEEKDDRVRVRVGGRPEGHPVEGWVLGSYLDPQRLTVARAQDEGSRAGTAGDQDGAQAWAERWLALDPTSRHAAAAVRTLAEARGDRATFARLADETVRIAACDGQRVELIASMAADGSITDAHTWDGRRSTLVQLSGEPWVEIRGGQPVPVEGSPFVRPFATDAWNEHDASPWTPGTCEGICEDQKKIVLGPCEVAGTLYVTGTPRAAGIQPGATPSPTASTVTGFVGGDATWSADVQIGARSVLLANGPQQGGMLVSGGASTWVPLTSFHYEDDGPPHRPWVPNALTVGDQRLVVVARQDGGHHGGWVVVVVEPELVRVETIGTWGTGC
ncbi:MAG: SH3 domain-containing protein [Alphaproteobacteria bacterium]|nr:SH3 domain-containing protein [Alphaproteobacteria bacterium]MCB9697456.1 SH3 domain-containing protein [Alphaproteobacteria bacterium]